MATAKRADAQRIPHQCVSLRHGDLSSSCHPTDPVRLCGSWTGASAGMLAAATARGLRQYQRNSTQAPLSPAALFQLTTYTVCARITVYGRR